MKVLLILSFMGVSGFSGMSTHLVDDMKTCHKIGKAYDTNMLRKYECIKVEK